MLLRLAILFFVLLELTYAMQCDCASGPEDKHGAAIVFRGTVVEFHEFARDGRTVVFRVSRVFNGDPKETFEMPALEGGFACFGFYPGLLRIGNELLVYASSFGSPGPADLSVRCGTKLWSETNNIRKLGRGKKPRSN
jgi:hypothetical protein